MNNTWLRARLIELDWTQQKLAKLADISTGALSKFMNGDPISPEQERAIKHTISKHAGEKRDIAQWIDSAVKTIGMTKKGLAKTMGMSYATVRAWCDGRWKPPDARLVELGDLFERLLYAPEGVLVPPIYRTYGDCKECPHREACISRVNIWGMPCMCEPISLLDLSAAAHADRLGDLVWWVSDPTFEGIRERMLG
jgi:transcriptional regulator with XRE-family HTH domain